MTRTTRTITVVGLSLLLAALASLGAYRAMTPARVSAAGEATRPVAVAARALPLGTRIAAEDVKLVDWPSRHVLEGSLHDAPAVVGLTVISPLVENEPLTESKLAPRDAGGGLPPAIPVGMRAISVKVNEVIGVAGFVAPNTLVDVLLTVRAQQESRARTVVSSVRVLTAGTRQEQGKADALPSPATVVTLLVTPADAERIALASMEGQLMLALRNPFDSDVLDTPGAALSAMMGTGQQPSAPQPASVPVTRRAPPAPPAAVADPPVAQRYMVEAIRGAKRTEEVVR